jgi:hypothetical protein
MNQFQHVTSIGNRDSISSLEDNLKSFLDWSFLNIGGYVNITIPTSGIDGNPLHQLKPVTDPSQKSKIWQAPYKDWIYESGLNNQNPIRISGIYLNDTFLPAPTGSGNYGYSINYPLGHVSFNSAVSASSKVELSYSYRYVQIYKSNESSWWKELQDQTYNMANFKANKDYSTITSNHIIQMPAIMIEPIARNIQTPIELGSSQNWITQDVLLHIFTENASQRSNLIDILLLQKDKTLNLYDINKVIKNNVFLLDYKGQINNSGLNYNQIVSSDTYFKHRATIKNSITSEINNFSSHLYNGIIRWSVEIFR